MEQNARSVEARSGGRAGSAVRAELAEDYISGQLVKATPEEMDAVQVLARRLVEDFGYSKDCIQTHPQFRVKSRPSDRRGSYPVDIAVFTSPAKLESELFLIAECKKKRQKEGLDQLKLYMEMSPARVGVWYNGEDHVYLLKVHHPSGEVTYKELPNIPRNGQRIQDIGRFLRADLRKASNLRAVFRDIRNHLAGNLTGITRDEALAQEIIHLLFCKIYDEKNTAPLEIVSFRCAPDESPDDVRRRIVDLFENKVKAAYPDVFSERDAITLPAANMVYVVGELQNYCVTEADRDAVGDAFEVFIGPALRGAEGQFFTPRNVVRMMLEILDPRPGDMILDPACGSGGFLIGALEYVWRQLEREAELKGWTQVQLWEKQRDLATRCFRGIDKDAFLAKVTKAYMAIMGDGRGGVFCDNSLLCPDDWRHSTRENIRLGSFDIVLTNPPFGTKIPIRDARTLSQYKLGHRWATNRATGALECTTRLHESQPPQILFLERCLQFLKPGGKLGIVLPEAVFGMPTYAYVVRFLEQRTKILGIVSMPEELFKTSGKGGTHARVCILFVQNTPPMVGEDYKIFMAEAKWCGHDSRGNPTIRRDPSGTEVLLDDVPLIAQRYSELAAREGSER